MRRVLPRNAAHACARVAASAVVVLLVAARARAGAPVFKIVPDTLRASEIGEWRASLMLENHGDWGLYPDTLYMDWVSNDPDASEAPRRGTRDLNALVKLATPAAVGDATGVEWTCPAEFERGTLTFRITAHDAQKTRYTLSSNATVVGSDLGDAHPSLMLKAGAQVAELVMVAADEAVRPAPTILYVPPSGVAARSLLRWAMPYHSRGYAVAIVSQPGSGRSGGAPDASGPGSVAAVSAALDRVAHEPGMDAQRVLLWGQGDGASTALLAGVKHPSLAGIVAMDASFDPWASYRAMPDSMRAIYTRAAGRDSAAWRARSPLAAAASIAAPVLVLQSLESGLTDTAPAEAFAATRADKQLYIESRLNGVEPHPFRRRDALRVAVDFMQRRSHKP